MSTLKWMLLFILTTSLQYSQSEDPQEQIKNKPGDNVTLLCQGPRDADIDMIKWNKTNLVQDHYVYLLRNKKRVQEYQDPSFHGRVELKDPEMKNGDVSVILKNFIINDTGIYKCYVGYGGKPELINTINLTVDNSGHNEDEGHKDGGDKDGRCGVLVGLLLLYLLVL